MNAGAAEEPHQESMPDEAEDDDLPPTRAETPSLRRSLVLLARMVRDHAAATQVARMASALSYTSLLALVPVLAIALAMLTAFPVFSEVRDGLMESLFNVLFPYADDLVREKVDEFVQAAGGLTALGVVGIAITAVMLLVTIETALNAIFGVQSQRGMAPRLLVYWALVTLGPLLLGASASLSGFLFTLGGMADAGPAALRGIGGLVARALPWVLTAVAFTLLFTVVPNRPVRPWDAAVGGIVAAILVAVLRFGFLVYATNAQAYQTLYGALAVIPVFLVWMYLSWLVVLAGAVITAVLPVWRMRRVEGDDPRHQDLTAALRVLASLQAAAATVPTSGSRNRSGVGRRGLLRDTGVPEERLRSILADLGAAGLVARAEGGRWLLARDLATVTLDDLLGLLDLRLPDTALPAAPPPGLPWSAALGHRLRRARAAERDALAVPLRTLLGGEDRGDG
ncbi:YihY family inner membrane protein [uncultured Rhodospira sp.]|uniref:YihY family inner membrane protein n=1 Tax=uncultured Rhodospira sp. TaxID=1936189 RepID=UPI00261C1C62|nr:YihY family inner membrane protein [uncultured Rhodospira sp.]